MKTFTIDSNNNLTAHRSDIPTPEGTLKFGTEQEFAAIAAIWPGARLVEIWNKLPGVKPVAKFTNRSAALKRIWKAVQALEPAPSKPPRGGARKIGTRAKTAKAEVTGDRPQTKTALVIERLREPAGATLQQLMALTGWQAHSVRGFLSAQLSKRMGLRIKSFTRDGERIYRIRAR